MTDFYEFDGQGGRCFICHIHFTSESDKNSHIKGARHLKRLNEVTLTQKKIPQPFERDLETDAEVSSTSNTQRVLLKEATSNMATGLSLKVQSPSVTSTSSKSQNRQDRWVTPGDKGTCMACGVQFTSADHRKQHLSGKKHAKRIEQLMRPVCIGDDSTTQADNGIYDDNECFICEVAFTSTKNREDHLSGKKHNKLLSAYNKGRHTDASQHSSTQSGLRPHDSSDHTCSQSTHSTGFDPPSYASVSLENPSEISSVNSSKR